MSPIVASRRELALLENLWRERPSPTGPGLSGDLEQLPGEAAGAASPSAEEAAAALADHLGWPEWVRFYPRPLLALKALAEQAGRAGRPRGITHLAPGTGAPLAASRGAAGLAVLRCDWSPDGEAPGRELAAARARGLVVVLDETVTGLRLGPDGARGYYGLAADLALYGPAQAGGRELAALAGRGEPPEPGPAPDPAALAGLLGCLALAARGSLAERLTALGRTLALGLDYFAGRAGVAGQVGWEGPLALPRLVGRRLWAFLALAEREGLRLAPLVRFDPLGDSAAAATGLWPRLARACAALATLPEGGEAPASWPEAQARTRGRRASEGWAAGGNRTRGKG